jgi:hypothetical protein
MMLGFPEPGKLCRLRTRGRQMHESRIAGCDAGFDCQGAFP